MHDCQGRVHHPENGSGNCEEREGRASSDGGHQLMLEDMPHPSGCAGKPPEDKAKGLE
jgi:hypothetical protein